MRKQQYNPAMTYIQGHCISSFLRVLSKRLCRPMFVKYKIHPRLLGWTHHSNALTLLP